jgi:hypothetical protein
VAVFVVVEAVILGIGFYYYQQVYASITNQVLRDRETLAALSASAMAIKLNNLAEIAKEYAVDPAIVGDVGAGQWMAGIDRVKDLLSTNESYYDYYVDRFVIFDKGGNVASVFPKFASDVIGQKGDATGEWLPILTAGGTDVYVSNVYLRTALPHVTVVNIVAPIRQATTGQITGFFELQIPTNSFSDFGKDIDMSGDGYAFYVDRVGKVVIHPKYPSGALVDLSSSSDIVKALLQSRASGSGVFLSNITGNEVVAAYQLVPNYGWGVVARESTVFAFAYRDSVLYRLAWAIAIVSVFNLLLCGMFLVRPFKKEKV